MMKTLYLHQALYEKNYLLMAQEWTRKNTELELAWTFSNEQEAYLAKAFLAYHDIEAILDNNIFGQLYPIGFNSIGGIRMMVRGCDRERAHALVESMQLGKDS